MNHSGSGRRGTAPFEDGGEPVAVADLSYGLHQRTFDPLPANDPRRRRVKEIRRYLAPLGDHERPYWNPSTTDEAHPFPQRALMHTVSHYDGVEVVDSHFPAAIKGTTALRISAAPLKKSGVWTANQNRARASNRHVFQPSSGNWDDVDESAPLSFLTRVIIDENTEEKKALRSRWCGSTAISGQFPRGHYTASTDPVDYLSLNKTKTALTNTVSKNYITPKQRVVRLYSKQLHERALQQTAAQETPLSMYERPDAPKVFKMSNIDSWYNLDPVRVATEQTTRKDVLRENPYSEYSASQRSK